MNIIEHAESGALTSSAVAVLPLSSLHIFSVSMYIFYLDRLTTVSKEAFRLARFYWQSPAQILLNAHFYVY